MKVFKRVESNGFEVIGFYAGHKIIQTAHALERLYEDPTKRFKETGMSFDELKNGFIWTAENAIDQLMYRNDKPGAEYGIHSKSKGFGMIADWRYDYKDKSDKEKAFVIVTYLPIQKFHHFKPTDIQIVTERLLKEWANSFHSKEHIRESVGSVDTYREDKFKEFFVTFCNGEYWNSSIDDWIFVK